MTLVLSLRLSRALQSAQQGLQHFNHNRLSDADSCFQSTAVDLVYLEASETDLELKSVFRGLIFVFKNKVARAIPATTAHHATTSLSAVPLAAFPHTPDRSSPGPRIKRTRQETAVPATPAHANATRDTGVQFARIFGQSGAVRVLRDALILPRRCPHLFFGSRRPFTSILLFGPPGTGKTLLAQALANEAGARLMAVSTADLLSKWVGESEKEIRAMFLKAQERRPTIIFLDEVDALCSSRDADSECGRRIKTQLLIEMQSLDDRQNTSDVLLLAATNLPWELDAAFRRRFQLRIHIGMPDEGARRGLLRQLTKHHAALSDDDLQLLAGRTEGFSAADVACFARAALMGPLAELQDTTHFIRVARPDGRLLWYPCAAAAAGAVECRFEDINSRTVRANPCRLPHFLASLENCHSSVGAEDLSRYAAWEAKFGQTSGGGA